MLERKQSVVRVLPWKGKDAELLEQLKRDPERGGVMLYDRFAGTVNRLVWRLLGDDPDHADVVQQVMLKLVTRARKVRDPEKLPGWVQRVTVHAVYSELRRRRVRRLFAQQQALTSEEVTPVSFESRDLLRRIYEVLDQLPGSERIAFVLRHVEQLQLSEVAEACGCSLATIKRRLAKAHLRFELLAQRHPDVIERFSPMREPLPGSPAGQRWRETS